MYKKGESVSADAQKAQELFEKACELKEGYSCSVAGSYYLEKQTPEGFKKAKEFFDKSCSLGDKMGCQFAGDLRRSKRL